MTREAGSSAWLWLCVAVVLGYQLTRPATGRFRSEGVRAGAEGAFDALPKGLQVTLADAYWLYTVQYYGEHLKTDYRFDSLPQIVDLVVSLSPRFRQAYISGAFALIDAGRPDLSYKLLQRGFEQFPRTGTSRTTSASSSTRSPSDKEEGGAACWGVVREGGGAARERLPGPVGSRPTCSPRAATSTGSLLLWAQVYAEGDKYSKERALAEMDALLSKDPDERAAQLEKLRGDVSSDGLRRARRRRCSSRGMMLRARSSAGSEASASIEVLIVIIIIGILAAIAIPMYLGQRTGRRTRRREPGRTPSRWRS